MESSNAWKPAESATKNVNQFYVLKYESYKRPSNPPEDLPQIV